jgi:hypothetical protein
MGVSSPILRWRCLHLPDPHGLLQYCSAVGSLHAQHLPTFFLMSSITLLIQLKGENARWNRIPPEGRKHPSSTLPIPCDDGQPQTDCDHVPKSSQPSASDMKSRKGLTTLYMGMKLIPMMSIMEAWACERRASPYSPCSFLLL